MSENVSSVGDKIVKEKEENWERNWKANVVKDDRSFMIKNHREKNHM